MFGLQNHLRSRHKIIVGIDYGTTFSGVSYVTTDKSDIDDIVIVSSWPGEQHAMWKTPTRIAYACENSQIERNKWGFEVDPKLISYSWTKLLLDKNASVGEHDDPALSKMVDSGMLQLPDFRHAAGVCEDFLHEVYVYVSKKLRQQMTDLTFDTTSMECWITLPAIWSDEAKDATLTAAKKAGFGNRIGDEVFTIAEPEAAAIATLKRFSVPDAINAIKVNENVLICDCGGGTVDITTYVITQVSPYLIFEELCVGVGGKCGSTYIDRNLHKLLSERFGSSFDNVAFTQRGPGSKFMISFEKHKRDFGLNDDSDVREVGPIRLNLPDSDHYDEEERMVKLTYKDMQSLFDPVILEITDLVTKQVNEARSKRNATIDRIILVGGFAESPYLNNALEDWCWKNGDIMLICPAYPQSAVVRGAALRGLEGVAPRKKYARKHYGVEAGQPFRPGIDPEGSSYYDPINNQKLCGERMTWIISKGDEIIEGTSRKAHFSRKYVPGRRNTFRDELFSCSLVDAPEYSTHNRTELVGVVRWTLATDFDYVAKTTSKVSFRGNRVVYELPYDVRVIFGGKGSNLTFEVLVDGKVMSTAEIVFDQG